MWSTSPGGGNPRLLLNLDRHFVEPVVVFNRNGNRLAVHRRALVRPIPQVRCLQEFAFNAEPRNRRGAGNRIGDGDDDVAP